MGRALTEEERRARRQAWNGGAAGEPAPPRRVPPPGGCPVESCGRTNTRGRVPDGMVRIEGRSYCTGWCAEYGRALADVRSLR